MGGLLAGAKNQGVESARALGPGIAADPPDGVGFAGTCGHASAHHRRPHSRRHSAARCPARWRGAANSHGLAQQFWRAGRGTHAGPILHDRASQAHHLGQHLAQSSHQIRLFRPPASGAGHRRRGGRAGGRCCDAGCGPGPGAGCHHPVGRALSDDAAARAGPIALCRHLAGQPADRAGAHPPQRCAHHRRWEHPDLQRDAGPAPAAGAGFRRAEHQSVAGRGLGRG